MSKRSDTVTVAPRDGPRKLAVYTLGFLQVPYIQKMLRIAGWQVRFGPFCRDADVVGVWGRKPLSKRGFRAAARRDLPVLSVEDAFLRSNFPGPASAPAGLIIDEQGIYFDATAPSTLENILNDDPLDDPDELRRAVDGIDFLRRNGLSKYNPVARGKAEAPASGYVLVVDQTMGDASITCGMANADSFAKMLKAAKSENPDNRIVIRTHPAVHSGAKTGHFSAADCDDRTTMLSNAINPWDLLEGATAVYCVTSQMGFEAILAGHKPRVFGMPFYAGWGLTGDEQVCARRQKTLTAAQLFAGAMLRYPVWVDPYQNQICTFEQAAEFTQAKAKTAWAAQPSSLALGMSSWKTKQVSRFLGYQTAKPKFATTPVAGADRAVVWASKATPELVESCAALNLPLWRMEDGFLRSVGLGAELTPADSVVLDELGIYFDATQASRLEVLIETSVNLPDYALARAQKLISEINKAGVTKYNLNADAVRIPATEKAKILVPGQVEDDASIRLGTDKISTNLALLEATRAANPDAFIIYKPHPDVEAGLRPGHIENAEKIADMVVVNASVPALLTEVDAVWTMTSLLGFEALMRGVNVTCLGMPFYAGWGLTDDHGQNCPRRNVTPSLAGLIHASLIDYPLYLDPVTKRAIPPESLIKRHATGQNAKGPRLQVLAKMQGKFARFAHLWR